MGDPWKPSSILGFGFLEPLLGELRESEMHVLLARVRGSSSFSTFYGICQIPHGGIYLLLLH